MVELADAAPRPDAEPPPPVQPPPPLAPVEGASQAAGAALFAERCVACHGADGRGRTAEAKKLRLAPTDLTTTAYLCRTTDGPKVGVPSDADVEGALGRGTHRDRPELTALDAVQRRSLTLHVKSLARDFAGDPQPLSFVPPQPSDSPESRARGRVLYLAFGCWACHGAGGAGDGPALKSLVWNEQPVTRLNPIGNRADYLCGTEPEQVYRTIALGMGGSTIMPRYDSYAEAQQYPESGPRETWGRGLEGRVSPEELEAVRKFFDGMPGKKTVQAMKPSERRARGGRFIWDLVHYVRSL